MMRIGPGLHFPGHSCNFRVVLAAQESCGSAEARSCTRVFTWAIPLIPISNIISRSGSMSPYILRWRGVHARAVCLDATASIKFAL